MNTLLIILSFVGLAIMTVGAIIADERHAQRLERYKPRPPQAGDVVLALENYKSMGIHRAGRYRVEEIKLEDGELWVRIRGTEPDYVWLLAKDFMLM